MPWRIADYTSSDENIESKLLNPAYNMTYRSLTMVLQLANDLLQYYSGEFIIPEEFKFKKEDKEELLGLGHIKRSFTIPGTITECNVYIIYVKPYKAPVVPLDQRRRSSRNREPVHYGEDNFNYERWMARRDEDEVEDEVAVVPEEEEVEFIEVIRNLNNFHIAPPAPAPAAVPRYLLGGALYQ